MSQGSARARDPQAYPELPPGAARHQARPRGPIGLGWELAFLAGREAGVDQDALAVEEEVQLARPVEEGVDGQAESSREWITRGFLRLRTAQPPG